MLLKNNQSRVSMAKLSLAIEEAIFESECSDAEVLNVLSDVMKGRLKDLLKNFPVQNELWEIFVSMADDPDDDADASAALAKLRRAAQDA